MGKRGRENIKGRAVVGRGQIFSVSEMVLRRLLFQAALEGVPLSLFFL